MPKPPLTPAEKEKQKQRKNLLIQHNLIVSRFNFHEIQTWHDVYRCRGFSEEYISQNFKPDYLRTKPTFPELKMYLEKEKQDLKEKLNDVVVFREQVNDSVPHFKEVKDIPADSSNSCTLLALKEVLNINFEQAEAILTREGFRNGRGTDAQSYSDFLKAIGFTLVNREVEPLENVLKKYPKGKFIIRMQCTTKMNHVFALIDGVVHDHERRKNSDSIDRVYLYQPIDPAYDKHIKEQIKVQKSDIVLQATQELLTDKDKVAETTHDEPSILDDKDYGYVRSPHVSKDLFEYWFQKKAAAEAIDKIVNKGARGLLVLAPTGTGKTFIEAMIDRHLIDIEFHEGKTWSHIPRLCITKRTVVEQTKRVFKKFFNIDPSMETEVVNIETLRSKAGQLWLKEKVVVENGEDKTIWEWKKNIHPCVIYFDESQNAKNKGSIQSKIIYAYNDIPNNTCLINISATPFTRVSEAQAFAVSTHRSLEHLGFPKGTILNNSNWPAYASIIASPSKPEDYNQTAVERLMEDLKEWIVRVRGVRPQFEAVNGVKIVQFQTAEERKYYDDAWIRFQEEQAKLALAKEAGIDTGACQLVILLKFAMAAEFCHARHFARDMYKCWQQGKAPVAAIKFKATLIEIVKILITDYGVNRDNISLIWGGGQTQQTDKQKAKEKLKAKEEKLRSLGIDLDEMLRDTGLDQVEDRVIQDFPEEWRLGPQSPEDRQKEIDKFQAGTSQFCLYTLKAGGVGLSLHHTDELTKVKCRRKKSGYAMEEDIPKIPVRQRETFMVVTYNAIELVQASGRVPRLTSLSPTIQNVYCFAGTIEVEMGHIYTAKFRCLSAVVKARESWQDLMFSSNRVQAVEAAIATTKDVANDESTLVDEGDIETDEEDTENQK